MRFRGVAVAAVVLTALLAPLSPSVATPTAAAISQESVTTKAASAAREARALRREAGALIRDYQARYGDRLTTTERERLDLHRATADRQLATVVVTTRRLSQLVASSATPARLRSAARAALSAHRRARVAAETSFEAVRATLEPRLSLWEGLQALRDYDAMIGRFDILGDRLTDISRSLR